MNTDAAACLFWMHLTARRLMMKRAPDVLRQVEDETFGTPGWQED